MFTFKVDLSGKDKSITKLHKAAWVGNLDKVKSLLKKIDVNAVDASNRTPLHLAAAQGHTGIVWFLLSNKAALDIVDVGGKSSFFKVCYSVLYLTHAFFFINFSAPHTCTNNYFFRL